MHIFVDVQVYTYSFAPIVLMDNWSSDVDIRICSPQKWMLARKPCMHTCVCMLEREGKGGTAC